MGRFSPRAPSVAPFTLSILPSECVFRQNTKCENHWFYSLWASSDFKNEKNIETWNHLSEKADFSNFMFWNSGNSEVTMFSNAFCNSMICKLSKRNFFVILDDAKLMFLRLLFSNSVFSKCEKVLYFLCFCFSVLQIFCEIREIRF